MAKRVKVSIDASSFQDLLTQFGDAFTQRVSDSLGTQVIIKMRDLIGKGVSPIETHGRFPEYKAQQVAQQAAELRKSARSRAMDFGNKDKNVKSARSAARELSKSAKLKYPDSVLNKFPNKRRRPVNLKLSGKFLDNGLEQWNEGLKQKFSVAIGFKKKPFVDYERGHREQANGQGFRPIIPQQQEKFVKSIRLIIDDLIKEAIDSYINKKR
jgi:hypothetical protein